MRIINRYKVNINKVKLIKKILAKTIYKYISGNTGAL